MAILNLTVDNWTRQAALRTLTAKAPDDEVALLLSETAFAYQLAERLGRPLHLIGSREYTMYRALSLVDYAQRKIIETRQKQRDTRAKGRKHR